MNESPVNEALEREAARAAQEANWDIETRNRRMLLNEGGVGAVGFGSEGTTLAAISGYSDCTTDAKLAVARVWDLATQEPAAVFTGQNGLSSLAVNPTGSVVAGGFWAVCGDGRSGGGGLVRLWDVRTRKPIAELRGGRTPMRALAFSPDGRVLAGGGRLENETSAVTLWDVRARKRLVTLVHPGASVVTMDFSPDGELLATGGVRGSDDSNAITLWKVATRENVATLGVSEMSAWDVAFSSDGTLLAGAMGNDAESRLLLWSTAGWTQVAELDVPQKVRPRTVAFAPDGRTLAVGGGHGDVHLWTKRTG